MLAPSPTAAALSFIVSIIWRAWSGAWLTADFTRAATPWDWPPDLRPADLPLPLDDLLAAVLRLGDEALVADFFAPPDLPAVPDLDRVATDERPRPAPLDRPAPLFFFDAAPPDPPPPRRAPPPDFFPADFAADFFPPDDRAPDLPPDAFPPVRAFLPRD